MVPRPLQASLYNREKIKWQRDRNEHIGQASEGSRRKEVIKLPAKVRVYELAKELDVTNKEIAELLKVQYQTTLLIFRDNKEIYRSVGETTEDLIYEAIKSSI